MNSTRLFLLTVIIAVITMLNQPLSVYADYKGHHSPGSWGLQSGTQSPTPGSIILSAFYTRYYANTLRDQNGNEIKRVSDGEQDIASNSLGLFSWWVSKFQIFGANWGMLSFLYFTDNKIEFASFNSDLGFGFSDVYIQPINLGWHFSQADLMVTYGLYIPIGRYSAGANNNTGMGMWTHEFGAGGTYYLDAGKKWHISAMGYFEISTKKQDADINVGNILTIEGGIGYSWFDGALMAGLVYYCQWKLSKDYVGGLDQIDPSLAKSYYLPKSHLYGLGPEIDVPIIINKKLISQITIRYQWEFGVRSTMEGHMFNLFLNFPL